MHHVGDCSISRLSCILTSRSSSTILIKATIALSEPIYDKAKPMTGFSQAYLAGLLDVHARKYKLVPMLCELR